MSSSDSTFMVEIVLEQLKSFVKCKEFIVKTRFADVFNLTLKDPNNIGTVQKPKRKRKAKSMFLENQSQTSESVAFPSNIDNLISNMQTYPIELTLWSQRYPQYKIASSNIPWNTSFVNFLNKIKTDGDTEAATSNSGEYYIFDEFTSRRMASVKLNIKLSYLHYSKWSKVLRQLDALEMISHKFNVNPPTSGTNIPLILTPEDTGIIKTIYSGGRKPKKHSLKKENNPEENADATMSEPQMDIPETNGRKKVNSPLITVKSEVNLHKKNKLDLLSTKSCSFIQHDKYNLTNYIFGDTKRPFGYQVYCVNYFTVESDTPKNIGSTETSKSSTKDTSAPEEQDPINFSMKYCAQECRRNAEDTGSVDLNTLEIPILPTDYVNVSKCSEPTCERRTFRPVPPPPDKSIYLDLTALNKDCCDTTETLKKVEQVMGGLKAKMTIGKADPCFCECECMFGITKKTTYCKVCRGYEELGEDINPKRDPNVTEDTDIKELAEMILDDMPPMPCPLYHNLMDKIKPSTTGSDSKQKSKSKAEKKSQSIEKDSSEKGGDKKDSSEKGGDKKDSSVKGGDKKDSSVKGGDKKDSSVKGGDKKDSSVKGEDKEENKFKFNYGYTAPKIGHNECNVVMGYPGDRGPVPWDMGWLWDCDDAPGMKYRPAWKPGAAPKHIVHLLKLSKNPEEALAKKKKKKVTPKPKRPSNRPLLTVHKRDGEFTIGLETMKSYGKPRNINQAPYEDKPPIIYKLGRTDEENQARHKTKERMKRRLEREQREFIQGAFRDMCEEICLKTYQQALGILPDAEKRSCPCYPDEPGADRTDLNRSCSCSEASLSLSDTDSDEWLLEVTPPVANYDPFYVVKKVSQEDTEAQYSYLDFRVKLVDRYGNPVPRFFTGPDGKQECSDLGGFWSPEKKWLEINVDGYIGPDGRWAPNTFIGPEGDRVDAEIGKFQTSDGVWLVVGIDGYVDSTGKWRYYSKIRGDNKQKTREKGKITEIKKPQVKQEKTEKRTANVKSNKAKKQTKQKVNLKQKKSEATWSCFGDASAKYLSEMGIWGHGHDRKLLLDTLKTLVAAGDNVKIPKPVVIPHTGKRFKRRQNLRDDIKCRHATPSSKGVVAVDEEGNKIYFRIKDSKNFRPTQRIATLTDQGISVSSFHVPCFHSFINNQLIKKRHFRNAGV